MGAPRPGYAKAAGNRPATASDVLLIIAVSGSTLRFDSDVKVPLYARHGIPEVWIVDLSRLLETQALARSHDRARISDQLHTAAKPIPRKVVTSLRAGPAPS